MAYEHEIEVCNLTKIFPQPKTYRQLLTSPFKRHDITVLRNISFSVKRGELFGLLGPNGAGKTTITKILSALLYPTSGTVRIKGYSVTTNESKIRRIIGCVIGEERSFYWRLTGRQNLHFFAALNNFEPARAKKRIDEIVEMVGLNENIDRVFQHYSSGMKQRLAIARALLADPDILILDEPTRNLDPFAKIQIRRLMKNLVKGVKNKTVVMATNDVEEAEDLCDRFAFIDQGTLRLCDSLHNIRSGKISSGMYVLRLKGRSAEIMKQLERENFPAEVTAVWLGDPLENQTSLSIKILDGDNDISDVIDWLVDHRLKLLACLPKERDLSGVFAKILE